MRLSLLLIVAVILLAAVPVFALPDYPTWTTYYDEDGEEVGGFAMFCNGGHNSWGTTTDNFVQEIGERCNNFVEPIGCGDMGLSTIGSCPVSSWCVSDGYAMSYSFDMVPDCGGMCSCGEGPTSVCNKLGSVCGGAWRPHPQSRSGARRRLLPPVQRALFHYSILDKKQEKKVKTWQF